MFKLFFSLVLIFKFSNINNPKDEEVEKNIKLEIIFNLEAISIGMKETQLLSNSEVKIIIKNFSYLKFSDFKFDSDIKFKTTGNKKMLCINL